MTAERVYTLAFPPDELPPAEAFWSLTAYDVGDLTLVENPLNRFQIGDRARGLEYEEDGALVIVLSAHEPKGGVTNWLPVAEGRFDLVEDGYGHISPVPMPLDGSGGQLAAGNPLFEFPGGGHNPYRVVSWAPLGIPSNA